MELGSKPHRPWRDIALVAGVALVARALYFAARASTDSFQLPIVDAGLFDKAARAFAGGRPTSPDDWVFHGVGYPALLGAIYTAFGPSVLCAKALQLAFGVATAVLTYLVARDIFDRPIALIAGLVVAVYAPLIFFEGELLDAGPTTLSSAAVSASARKPWRHEFHRWPA